MSRCAICNYCEATGSPSHYESSGVIHQGVKYRKSVNKDLCDSCWDAIYMNKQSFEAEAREKSGQIEFNYGFNEREYEEEDEEIPPWFEESFKDAYEQQLKEQDTEQEMGTNTPALSEV